MDHWQRVLPVRVLEVEYEETVADLEHVARRLVVWCGLDWEPACLAFHEGKRPVRTASVSRVRQPIYNRSVARWKHYEPALCALFDRLGRGATPDQLFSSIRSTIACTFFHPSDRPAFRISITPGSRP